MYFIANEFILKHAKALEQERWRLSVRINHNRIKWRLPQKKHSAPANKNGIIEHF